MKCLLNMLDMLDLMYRIINAVMETYFLGCPWKI